MVTNLILAILYFRSSYLGSELYSYPINNWQSYVFSDMKVILSSDKCPEPYTDSIFHFKWPGTIRGCECESGGQINKGSCCHDTQTK
jgi:hypothetical protein